MKFLYTALVFAFSFSTVVNASHVKGGEIRATQLGNQLYKISVLIYFESSIYASEIQSEVQVCTGDGQVIKMQRISYSPVADSPGTTVGLFEGKHTYQTPGVYQISVSESPRRGALNFNKTTDSPLFLWTVLNTEFLNSTPIMPYLRFSAGVRQLFSLDLKSKDSEGDSVSFRLQKLSKPSPGTCGVRSVEQSYTYPNDVSKTGTFTLSQTEKKLFWTAPDQVGGYLYAVIVDEWRGGIKISETYREGFLSITDQPGPVVEIPAYVYAEENGGIITALPKLESPEITIAIEAYPVPTEDYLNVKAYSKRASVIRLQLIDLRGQVLEEMKSRRSDFVFQEQFDLRRYPSGIYLIRADNGSESVSQKIMR